MNPNIIQNNINSKTISVCEKRVGGSWNMSFSSVFRNSQISSLLLFPFFSFSLFFLCPSSCVEWHSKDHGRLHVHESELSPFIALTRTIPPQANSRFWAPRPRHLLKHAKLAHGAQAKRQIQRVHCRSTQHILRLTRRRRLSSSSYFICAFQCVCRGAPQVDRLLCQSYLGSYVDLLHAAQSVIIYPFVHRLRQRLECLGLPSVGRQVGCWLVVGWCWLLLVVVGCCWLLLTGK